MVDITEIIRRREKAYEENNDKLIAKLDEIIINHEKADRMKGTDYGTRFNVNVKT